MLKQYDIEKKRKKKCFFLYNNNNVKKGSLALVLVLYCVHLVQTFSYKNLFFLSFSYTQPTDAKAKTYLQYKRSAAGFEPGFAVR